MSVQYIESTLRILLEYGATSSAVFFNGLRKSCISRGPRAGSASRNRRLLSRSNRWRRSWEFGSLIGRREKSR